MNGILLDTNVLSELTRARPDQNVLDFLVAAEECWISVITLHELAFGIDLLPHGQRRIRIHHSVMQMTNGYADRILPIQTPVAERAAHLRSTAQKSGVTLHLADALIAATALVHNLSLATRNISDFSQIDIRLIDPWVGH